jgi:tRNA (cytidine/uridine-2'-O-)-methyltransferase
VAIGYQPCEIVGGLKIGLLLHAILFHVYAANWRSNFRETPGKMRVALYQPDIPQNTGTILRLAACLNVAVDVIEPAGFDLSGRALKRAALDYFQAVHITRWSTFEAFRGNAKVSGSRIVLLTAKSGEAYHAATFDPADILLAGRESAGVPEEVHASADLRLCIPMREDLRSLNVAVALAMVLGEGLRQTGGFPRFA